MFNNMWEQMCEFQGPWRLTMAPNAEVVSSKFDPHTLKELEGGGYPSIPATVPGSFELDLVAAGAAPDPFFSQNAWEFQKYENQHLWYSTTFSADGAGDADTYLQFGGIDTYADIWLNGRLLGHTENMLVEHEFCMEGLLRAKNELLVHIFPTCIAARQHELNPRSLAQRYNYESLAVRKAGYMFGWDIMPRFVSGGLWRPVTLIRKPRERVEQCYLFTTHLNPELSRAKISVFFEIHTPEDLLRGLRLTVDAVCGASQFHCSHDIWATFGKFTISVPEPLLWYPKNAGKPNLYRVTVRLWRGDTLCDEKSFKFGIRTAELLRSSITDADGNGEFVFRINGKKVFCMGTNWVPLDAFPARSPARRGQALELLDELGCNMVRCWGGGVYEDDSFFDFCDEHGIMVWQDFSMGCGIYPQDARFAEALYREAVKVIRRLRSHAALVLWAGDNENDVFCPHYIDPNDNILTRRVLPMALREHDPIRPYLPSSPYVDEEAYRTRKKTSEDHLWGPRDDFKGKFYCSSVCHFASETGYHGCPSPASLRRFLAKDMLWPITDNDGRPNDDWICHAAEMQPGMSGPYAYRIELMLRQAELMFGHLPDNIELLAKESQASQAEALKFFIERFRLSKWRRTGILWWNLLDGWPQISDAVVDWYFCKKLAYHFIKRSQAPICLMLDEPQDGALKLYAVNDLPEAVNLQYSVRNLTDGERLIEGSTAIPADSSSCVHALPMIGEYAFLLIEWQTDKGIVGSNHYITETHGLSAKQYFADLERAGYDRFEGF